MRTILKVLGGVAVLVAILLAAGIGKFIGKTTVDSYYAGKREGVINEVLLKAADKLNSKLPMMVDANTRLDSTIGLNERFRYNYTLVNYSSAQISSSQIHNVLGQKLVNNVCTNKEMQAFVNNGVTVSYAYFGNDGKEITVISIAPSQCSGS